MTRRLRPLEECSQSVPAKEVKEMKPGDSILEMQVLHRNLNSGKEVVGFSWFKRIGPYPDPIPQRRVEAKEERGLETTDGDKSGADSNRSLALAWQPNLHVRCVDGEGDGEEDGDEAETLRPSLAR